MKLVAVPARQRHKSHLSVGEAPKHPQDLSAAFKVAYSDKYLFLAFNVTDDVYINEGTNPTFTEDSIEIWLDGQNLGKSKHADTMGFDVQLNDNDANRDPKGKDNVGIRQTGLAWSGGKDVAWQDSSVYGDLILK